MRYGIIGTGAIGGFYGAKLAHAGQEVRIIDDRCSPQAIVTRCTLYEQYTTEEALQTAAKSYGGLTETPFP